MPDFRVRSSQRGARSPRPDSAARLALLALLALMFARPADAGWELRSQAPSPRYSASAVIDEAQGMLYVFGGVRESVPGVPSPVSLIGVEQGFASMDMVTGAAREWSVAGPHPSTQGSRGMFLDAARGRLVLPQASRNFGPLNQVWAFDLSSHVWMTLPVSGGPSGLAPSNLEAAIAHDVAHDRILLWGGSVGDSLWSFTLADNQWHLLPAGGVHPPLLTWPAGAVDAARNQLIVYGESGGTASTWAVSLGASPVWSRLATTGPAPLSTRHAHAFVDAANDRLLLVGDYLAISLDVSSSSREVASLPLASPSSWTILRPYSPPPLFDTAQPSYQPAVAFDAGHSRIVAFSGAALSTTFYLAEPTIGCTTNPEVHEFAPAVSAHWSSLPRFGPVQASERVVATDPVTGRIYCVANTDITRTYEIATAGTTAGGYREIAALGATTPPRLVRMQLSVDAAGRRLVLYGCEPQALTTPVLLTMPLEGPAVWSVLPATGSAPSPRDGATSVYDLRARRMVLFGGDSAGTYTNATHILDLAGTPHWSRLVTTGAVPIARTGQLAVLDPAGERMLMFGGRTTLGLRNDLWQLSLGASPTWAPIALPGAAAIPPRAECAGYFDAAQRRIVVLGGQSPTLLFSDQWQLPVDDDTANWSLVPGVAPGARRRARIAQESTSGRVWLLGGLSSSAVDLAEVWSLDDAGSVVGVGGQAPPVAAGQMRFAPATPEPSRGGDVTLSFALHAAAPATLEVFDVRGRRVRAYAARSAASGWNRWAWDGRDDAGRRVPAGIYLCRIVAGDAQATRRVTVLR